MIRRIALVLTLGSLVLAGCAGTTPGVSRAGGTAPAPEQREFRAFAERYAVIRNADDAAAGAFFGAMACAMFDCDAGEALRAGIAGGNIGSVARAGYRGGAVSPDQLSRKDLLADRDRARERLVRMRRAEVMANKVNGILRQRVARLLAAGASGEATRAEQTVVYRTLDDDDVAFFEIRRVSAGWLSAIDRTIVRYRAAGLDPSPLIDMRAQQAQALAALVRLDRERQDILSRVPAEIRAGGGTAIHRTARATGTP